MMKKAVPWKIGSLESILKRFKEWGNGILHPAIVLLGALIFAFPDFAVNIDRFSTTDMSPNDYFYGSNGHFGDPVFDRYHTVDLNVNLGVTSDCGRISIHNTLRSSLKAILDKKYLEDMGHTILAASPMLLTCYFSPTWCAILKHAQLKANYLAQLRLDQCKAINRFVDQRSNDYYQERSRCIQGAIKEKEGDFEQAMDQCGNDKDYSLANWAGGARTKVNALIDSTAKWAGMTDEQSKRVVDLTKAFVGDSVIQDGNVSVFWGPRKVQLTPRTYLMEVKDTTFKRLCDDLLPRLMRAGGSRVNIYSVISEDDLKEVSGSNKIVLDYQTMRSLSFLPYKKRQHACRKLSDALAMGIYTDDMGKSLDFISSKLMTNPNLPSERRAEADNKRRVFKDQIELTLDFEVRNSDPINQVLYQINKEGKRYSGLVSERELESENESHQAKHVENMFFDCADGIGCQ